VSTKSKVGELARAKRTTVKRKTAKRKAVKRETGAKSTGASAGSARRPRKKAAGSSKRWSKGVMEHSDAMDLKSGVFKLGTGRAIARSLKTSSEASTRRKSSPFRSAMSMLNFEINRAGKNLSQERRSVLNQAKVELRKAFGRPA
jgi:hypothetical protein